MSPYGRLIAANQTVTIPVGGSTARYTVDWGDGMISENVTGDQSHTYADAGTHTVRIYGDFERIHLGGGNADNAKKLQSIGQWGAIEWSTMAEAFRNAKNVMYDATDTPNLSGVTDMSGMFRGAAKFNGDISSWNVSQVTDMNYMFAATKAFNQPLGGWNVSQVTNMAAHV